MIRLVLLLFMVPWAASCGGGGGASAEPGAEEPDRRTEIGDRTGDRRGGAYPGDDEDDGGDENLAVEGLRGRMDTYEIQRGIEPHAAAIDGCFQSHIKRKGYIGGRIVLEFVVTPTGDLKHAQIKESDLGAWAIERCLLEVARQMEFGRPKGGEADFTVPLEWGATRPVQWWTEEQAELAIEERPDELGACAETAGAEVRNVWVTLYVGARGEVQSVGFASPARHPAPATYDAWADCAASVVMAWTLPDPRGTITKLGFRYKPQ